MSLNVWTKPSGYSIGTFPERDHISVELPLAYSSSINLVVISGSLPSGLFIEDGSIVGSPYVDDNVLNYEFCIRASSNGSFSDRTLTLQISDVADPEFITPAGELAIGVHKQFYVLDGSYVSYQIEAIDLNPVPGQTLKYSIEEDGGVLPPGLILSESGLINGFVGPSLVTPVGVPHVFTMPYFFTVTVTDGINFSDRTFEIFVADPDAFRADSLMLDGLAGRFTSDSTYLQQPVWLTSGNLGLYRANNYITIPVAVYDNKSTVFRLETTNVEMYVSTIQVAISDNHAGSSSLTVTNTSDVPVVGQYFTFLNYIDIADNTVYRILSVVALGDDVYRLGLSRTLVIDVDNGFTFYIGSASTLPPGMSFDTVTSEIYGRVPYQPAITTEYTFTIAATKSYIASDEQVVSYRTFTINLLGDVTSKIVWNSPDVLGPLNADYVSTLGISASSSLTNAIVIYEQVGGILPPGLSLSSDGELIGVVHQYYNPLTEELGLITFDNSTTIFDNNTTTFDRSFKFTVAASDQYQYSSENKEFTLVIDTPNSVPFSNVYAKPFLDASQRSYWTSFIVDTNIFTPEKIYRPNDPEFGVQESLRMLVLGGIETDTASAYATSMINGFKRKQFHFDSIKTAIAVDPVTGESLYEVIYAQLSDPSEPDGKRLPNTVNGVYHINSITNWQERLSAGLLTERNYLPHWMRTIQPGTKEEIGFTPAVTLCYCKLGYSADIMVNIKNSGFDFRTIDYTIDRFIIDSVTGSVGDKYLAFRNDRTTI